MPESPTFQKQPYFKPNSPIMLSEDLGDFFFEAYNIVEAKNKVITRFIDRRIDIAVELAENQAYLKIILKERSDSTFINESPSPSINSGLDIGLETKKISSSG